MQQAQGEDKSFESQIFGLMQRFMKLQYVELSQEFGRMMKTMKPFVTKKHAKRPVIIHLDDYLRNEQHGIWRL